ncbi:hypothetical protein BKI52_07935 [marine bacterium AO1-C]|nr:hypothetical protein BKI52_07935 [marine bacterium AO1-C]
MLIKKTMAVLACLWVLNACTNTRNEVTPTKDLPTAAVVVKNGALHFKNQDAFINIITQLNGDNVDLNAWEESINFTNSLRQHQEDEEGLDIPDPVFASILNTEGVYYIGKEVHKVTPKYEYVVKDGNTETLEAIVAGNTSNLRGVKVHEIKYGVAAQSFNARFQGKSTRKKTPYSNATHLSAHLEAWDRTYALYASVGIRIKGRKKKRRKWKDDEMWFAEVTWRAYTEACVPSCTGKALLTGTKSGTNTKSVSKTINYAAGTGAWHVTDYIEGDFRYNDDGYPMVSWSERWD